MRPALHVAIDGLPFRLLPFVRIRPLKRAFQFARFSSTWKNAPCVTVAMVRRNGESVCNKLQKKGQRVKLRCISFQEITRFHKFLFCREHDYSLDLV
jgi:hypothetical protein